MPTKGYKQNPVHRRRIASANAKRAALVRDALAQFNNHKPTRAQKFKPDPIATPIPPSASKITADLPQRWGIYSHHAEGRYYYKRDQGTSLKEVQKLIRALELDYPMWTYVKSGRTDAELILPIRIPEEAVKTLGQRWHFLKKPTL